MTALDDIAAERRRQIEAEGWTAEHDDTHTAGQLANAAACYAHFATVPDEVREVMHACTCEDRRPVFLRRWWMWSLYWWKPKDPRRDLVRAGARIVAEIERLDRETARGEERQRRDRDGKQPGEERGTRDREANNA